MTEVTAYQDAESRRRSRNILRLAEMTVQQVTASHRTEQPDRHTLDEIEDAKSDMRAEIARYEVANKLVGELPAHAPGRRL